MADDNSMQRSGTEPRAYDAAYSQSAPGASPHTPSPQGMPMTSTPFVEPTAPSNGSVPAATTVPSGPHTAKSGKGWIVAIVIAAIFAIMIMFSVASCNAAISSVFDPFSGLYDETEVSHASGPSIALIEINGTIQYDGTTSSPEGLSELLSRAEEDKDIEGVILRVNSGGGVATAGEEMSGYVRDFSKPIVVSSASTNCSAAYEISSQADRIFTAKTTSIGAIGVLMQVTDLSGLYDKLGISVDSITSTDSKDAGSGARPLTDEERKWYQAMVDQIDADFVATVAEGRDMTVDEVRKLANGMPFTGMDAVENGLADEIGGLEDALEYISCTELGHSKPLPLVDYAYSPSSLKSLLDMLGESEQDDAAALAALLEKFKDSYGTE